MVRHARSRLLAVTAYVFDRAPYPSRAGGIVKGLLFTYLLTYGGAAVSLFNPYYGLLIYVCFSILMPPALWPWSVPIGPYSRIIGAAFLAGWVLNGFGDAKLGKARALVLPLLGYFLCVVLSTQFSAKPEIGMPFVEFIAKTIVPFIAGVTLVQTRRQLNQLLCVILASCAFLAYEANLAYLGGLSIEQYGFRMLDNNTFSIFIVTAFGLPLILGFEATVAWVRYLCFGIAAAMAHVPMLAFSRGGMLGIAVAFLAAVVVTPKTRRTIYMVCAGIAVGSILAGSSVIDEFSTSFNEGEARDASSQSRLDLWRDCADVAMKYPLWGVGQGHWRLIAHEYGWPPGKAAHSLWFETAAETGLPSVALLAWFYYRTMIDSWRTAKRSADRETQMTARMVIVSLSGFLVAGCFLSVQGFELPFYIALIGACNNKLADDDERLKVDADGYLDDDELPLTASHVIV